MSPESTISVETPGSTITVSLMYNQKDKFYYRGDISLRWHGPTDETSRTRLDELCTEFHRMGERLLQGNLQVMPTDDPPY